jgi:hypothetical protein
MSRIFFHIFLKLVNMIFDFFKQLRALVPKSQKHFPVAANFILDDFYKINQKRYIHILSFSE